MQRPLHHGEVHFFDGLAFEVRLVVSGVRTVAALARRTGIGRSTLSLVRHGWLPTRRMREAIASALGAAPEELWPTTTIARGAP
jgi:lambda repressor-like predicted transcriptional regulator